MNLGNRIKELRKAKKITLVELAELTGVAQATLSRIETGVMQGTVESHRKIAEALGVSLSELYASLEGYSKKAIYKEGREKKETLYHNEKVKCELLTSEIMKKKITPLMITIAGKCETPQERKEKGVEKFLFVLEGNVTVTLDKNEYNLSQNDSLYFDASQSHRIINRGSRSAKIFCTVSPPNI